MYPEMTITIPELVHTTNYHPIVFEIKQILFLKKRGKNIVVHKILTYI